MSLYTVQVYKDGRLVADQQVKCLAVTEEPDKDGRGGELVCATEAQENAAFERDLECVLKNWNSVTNSGALRNTQTNRMAAER